MLDGEIMQVDVENLVTEVLKLKHRDYRLIQICAAKAKEGFEVTYSFGKEYKMVGLRLCIAPGTEIVSISDIYAPAFLYENEIHDFFGLSWKTVPYQERGAI